MSDLNYQISCKCGGSLTFKVDSVNYDKQYLCPNCSVNLGVEVINLLMNVKNSLDLHCKNTNPLNNVRMVYLNGKLI